MSGWNENNSVAPQPVPANRTSDMAIVSLVMGILGWTAIPFIGGLVASWAGEKARQEIRESAGRIGGDGLAIAGLVLGYTNLVFSFVFCLCMAFAFASSFSR